MSKRDGIRWKTLSLKEEKRLTAGLVHHRWPAWSPDGAWMAFAVGEGLDAVWVVTDRRGRVARTLPGPADGGASFAPDGALAFGRRLGGLGEIWLTPGAGAPAVRLLGGDGQEYSGPAFAPDGATLAFATTSTDQPLAPPHLQLLEIATGLRHALPADPARADAHPSFAPGSDGGDVLWFEGKSGSEVTVFAVDLPVGPPSARPTGLLTGAVTAVAAGRRPAPLSRDLAIIERTEGDRTGLVLVERGSGKTCALTPSDAEHREPSALRQRSGKSAGRIKLAYTTPLGAPSGPRRSEVCAARLKGLQLDLDVPPEAAAST